MSLPQEIIDTLASNYNWNSSTVTYSFYEDDVFNGSYYGPETGTKEVSEGIKANVREVLALVETFIDLNFEEVSETDTSTYGQLRYMLSDDPSYAKAYYPGGSDRSGDVHFNPDYDKVDNLNGFQNRPGKHGYTTLIHETFHALGLNHPHDGTVLDAKQDNLSTTVMSYDFRGNSFNGNGPGTAMTYDIGALQYIYGAADHNTGDDTYVFGTTTDLFTVNGQSPFTTSHRVKQTIWDSDGIDTLDFSGLTFQSEGYLFNLNEGGWLVANAQDITDSDGERYFNYGTSLAYGMTIENIIGSPSDDTIMANDAANSFLGYAIGTNIGNDTLIDTNELDTLDLSSYLVSEVTQSQTGDDLLIDLGDDGSVSVKDYYAMAEANRLQILFKAMGGDGADMLIGQDDNDKLVGGNGDDTLDGGDGNDTLNGGNDNDSLIGSNGNDILNGGNGNDTLDGGVGKDKLYGQNDDDSLVGGDNNDTLNGGSGADELWGQNNNDSLVGGDGNDTLNGGAGNDKLYGQNDNDSLVGGDGNDTLNGGAGKDKLYGQNDNDKLVGGNGNDTLNGGNGHDTLYGGADNDKLYGQNDNDKLVGGNGNDTLSGDLGLDSLTGGVGSDRFKLLSGLTADQDIILDYEDGVDLLDLTGSLTFAGLTITQVGADTEIIETATNETLATLVGTDATTIDNSDFV